MGNFPGHALPGSFFIVFALWHMLQLSLSYFRAKQRNAKPFKSSTYFLSPCCSFPLESCLKLSFCTIGIIGEAITGMKDGKFVHIGNSQHITMFFFFGMCGLVEMLHFYRFHLPPNSVHMSYILALTIEGLLFKFHLHGREDMDVQVHVLLLYVIAATIACVFIEMHWRRAVLPALCRVFLILLQGLWFWQVAFILYPPEGFSKWDQQSHPQMMLVTVVFATHAGASLLTLGLVWFCVASRYGNCRIRTNEEEGYSSLAMKVLQGHPSSSKSKPRGDRLIETDEEEEDELFSSANQ